jgi:hypothetical protein
LNLVAAVVLDKQKRLGGQAEALACANLSVASCSKHIQGVLQNGADPEILLSRPVLLDRSKALLEQEYTLLPEASDIMFVDTNPQALLEAMGRFGRAFVPDVSVEHCKVHGSGIEPTQLLEQAIEFVVELCAIDGEPACIGCGKGGNGEEAMAAAVGRIVTIDVEVVGTVGMEEEEEEEMNGAAGAGAGAGGAAAPPLPPPPAIVVTSANADDSECKYKCCYTPTIKGTMRINVRVLGQHVPNSPFTIETIDKKRKL